MSENNLLNTLTELHEFAQKNSNNYQNSPLEAHVMSVINDGEVSPVIDDNEELEIKLGEVMILLDKCHHPHTSIIVTATTSEIVEGVKVVKNDTLRD